MADNGKVRIEKRGGYRGGLPASAVGPPPKTPSGTATPAAAAPVDKPKRKAS